MRALISDMGGSKNACWILRRHLVPGGTLLTGAKHPASAALLLGYCGEEGRAILAERLKAGVPEAMWGLMLMGDSAVSNLLDNAKHSSPSIRSQVMACLSDGLQQGRFQEGRSTVLRALQDGLADNESHVRECAALALARQGHQATQFQSSLLGGLHDESRQVRLASALAVLSVARADSGVRAEAVRTFQQDYAASDELGRLNTLERLVLVGSSMPELRPVLLASLPAIAERDKYLVMLALTLTGAPRAEEIPMLMGALDSADDRVVSAAAFMLGNLGLKASSAKAKLQSLAVKHASPEVRASSRRALSQVQPSGSTRSPGAETNEPNESTEADYYRDPGATCKDGADQ